MSIYAKVKDTIRELIPDEWELDAFEAPEGPISPDATTVELKLRTVQRLDVAVEGAYQVDWLLTITTQYPERDVADPDLFDRLIELLYALDTTPDLEWIAWNEATKAVNEDGRLAYDITLITYTQKEEA